MQNQSNLFSSISILVKHVMSVRSDKITCFLFEIKEVDAIMIIDGWLQNLVHLSAYVDTR